MSDQPTDPLTDSSTVKRDPEFLFTAGGRHYALGEEFTKQLRHCTAVEQGKMRERQDIPEEWRDGILVNVSVHNSTDAYPSPLELMCIPVVRKGNNRKRHVEKAKRVLFPLKIWTFPQESDSVNWRAADAICRLGFRDLDSTCVAGRVVCHRPDLDVYSKPSPSGTNSDRAYLHLDFREEYLQAPGNMERLAAVVGETLGRAFEGGV